MLGIKECEQLNPIHKGLLDKKKHPRGRGPRGCCENFISLLLT